MENKTEKLNRFFEEVKTLTFWKRLFGWSQFRTLSYGAYEEFKLLLLQATQSSQGATKAEQELSILENNHAHLQTKVAAQEVDLSASREKIVYLEKENAQLSRENIIFKQTEESRSKEYEKKAATLDSIKDHIQNDRQKEVEQRQQEEFARLAQLKETWARHQDRVQEVIKGICQKHTVEYVSEVPFKGSPDNTIKISDEFIVFDAKSPASDDLDNFPSYIKLQAESVKKYIKEEGVKRDIYLVIPSNTVERIDKLVYNMGDYNVYIVTLDALEPIILSLKKIEDYEFVDQLSPEERDNIHRVIGRFVHLTKRRVQVDQYFSRESLDALSKSESDLPHDALGKVAEYELAEKLNPPQEKRSKSISIKELDLGDKKIRKEAEAKSIVLPTPMNGDIENLPLYIEKKAGSDS